MTRIAIMTYPTIRPLEYPMKIAKWRLKYFLLSLMGRREEAAGLHNGGHNEVTSSIIRGLRMKQVDFALNPWLGNKYYDITLVLSGKETLNQAIRLKKKGKIGKLLAGPNITISPQEVGSSYEDQAVDKILVPSDWVKEMYAQILPAIKDKIYVWPSGIDAEGYWSPRQKTEQNKSRKKHFVIYEKQASAGFDKWEECKRKCIDHFRVNRIEYSKIVYGKYKKQVYRTELADATAVVWISDSTESQCIALLEAWSMGVKTYVSDNSLFYHKGRRYSASSAPYLSDEYGCFFNSWEDLKILLESHNDPSDEEIDVRHHNASKKFSDYARVESLLNYIDLLKS